MKGSRSSRATTARVRAAHALLAQHVERAEVERAFERAGQPGIGLRIALAPQPQRAGAHEDLGMAGAARGRVGPGADLVGLAQVARGMDLREAGLHLDQRAHRGLERAAAHAGATVREGLGVEAVAPRGLQMARVGARIGRGRLQQPVDHQVAAVVARPQQVMGELVAEHGLQLGPLQPLEQRAREHDVGLARQHVDGGVHRAVVALVERDRYRDAEPLRDQHGMRMQLWMRVGVEPVRLAQQLGAHGRRMLLARLGRGGPAPGLGFVRPQVGGQRLLVGQRHQLGQADGRKRGGGGAGRGVDHVGIAGNKSCRRS
nr:hypothetical protein [Variovorax sp.]